MHDIHWKTTPDGSLIAHDRACKDEIVAAIPPARGTLSRVAKIKSTRWIETPIHEFLCDEDEALGKRHVEEILKIQEYLTIPFCASQSGNWSRIGDSGMGDPGHVKQYAHCAAYVARAFWLEKPWYFFDGTTVRCCYATAEQAMRACDYHQNTRKNLERIP